MQGDPHATAGNGRRFLAVLVLAHVATATATVALAAAVGQLVAPLVPDDVAVGAVVVLAAVAASVDLAAAARRRMAPGLRRQTPKEVGHAVGAPWWLTPLVWGGDTGIMGTTFRVTSGAWLLLAAALLGVAPALAGTAYGLGFALPLALTVLLVPDRHVGRIGDRAAGRGARLVQVASAGVLLAPLVVVAAG